MEPVTHKVRVRVPATSANLGSGFDTVGLALDYHDELEFTLCADPLNKAAQVLIEGEGADTLPRDESHLVVATFRRACEHFGLARTGFILEAHNNIPQARGMGSSAEAIVAAITAAYAFSHDGELDRDAVFELAARIEGHPDNVAPAVYGGMTVSWTDAADTRVFGDGSVVNDGYRTVRYLVDPSMTATVFVPDYELSTAKAREALPATVPFADAVHNVARASLLIGAMNPAALADRQDPNALLMTATEDRMHQQYRGPLMQPSADLIAKLRAAGFAAAVSGAGPCVLVLHAGDADAIIDAVATEQLESGHWKVLHLPIDAAGVQVSRS
ncbi:homoserine kinase [Bifidobacterium cuniculi]|uniref:Homoserine kinase n=1 Tax=Bifidobacterium cuniculi TaxID=1688 RepID=A0A087B588_9BIFI|nr:homoserine kinase [Bifidobacterium cuniculi]KFI66188.1 homoserine kinase [Bifidobacterium cuniculi]